MNVRPRSSSPSFAKRLPGVGLLGAFLLLTGSLVAATATLELDVANPGSAVSGSFYGLMTEEINYSYDGGLYAELVRNRSFQDPSPGLAGHGARGRIGTMPPFWSVVGKATAGINDEDPVNSALPVHLRVMFDGAEGGVANEGYWGVPIKPSTRYQATFYARGLKGFNGKVTVSLRTNGAGVDIVSGETEALGTGWRRYTVELETPVGAPTTAEARLVLSAQGVGGIDLSMVSLFPPTYGNVVNGLRPDLMEMMAAMRPAFIRLPGGNYVEGGRFADRFAWKKMIGPVDKRPGHMGCWGYRSSDGFGLPEYLLWCKQLGAEPVLALFAGYTLNGDYVAGDSPEMELYTKEALEEIEYVMGPADSEWGRRRAADGFPEPFKLRYVEIGNEDFFDRSGSYEGRFAHMAKAIREKYPQLKIIATMPVKSFKPDLIDDHLYANANSMMRQGNRYDAGSGHPEGRRADGTEVFMGEWATQGGSPTPNLMSALADAVFVMGMERNSDAVVMQCYAPLFANVNKADDTRGRPRGWQWATNLIGYDALRAFGSPSYHMLAVFGQNRGDRMLPATLTLSDAPRVAPPQPQGAIGLGRYGTKVEYSGLEVRAKDGRVLASSSPAATGPAGWRFAKGKWSHDKGVLSSVGEEQEGWALQGDETWGDYTVTVRARKLGGGEGFLLLWHAKDGDNFRWWNIGGWGNTVSRCEVAENGGREPYGPSQPFTVETGRWYELRLVVEGTKAKGYVDGRLVMEANDEPYHALPPAFASASWLTASGELVVKVVNTAAEPLETTLVLKGARSLGPGRVYTIQGQPADENSLEQPTKVAPVEAVFDPQASRQKHTFPPYSITLLRFPASPGASQ